MQITDYIERNSLTHRQAADRLGLSRAFVTQLVSGARFPDFKTMLQIEEASAGQIGLDDWKQTFRQLKRHEPAADKAA